MPWTCEQTEDRLLDALDGTLDATERSQMEEHLAGCAKCATLTEGVRQTVSSLHRLEPIEPAPWLAPAIIARTSGTRPVRSRRRFAWLDFLVNPRFAMGLVAVLITVSVLFHALAGGAPPSLAAMNPLDLYHQVDRRAHLAYARGVKFISDLRVVYEIQSRFQPQNSGEPAPAPEKKSTDQLERLFYGRLESRLLPVVNHSPGDKNEMRYPS
jgi:anti-sigma factor RsiW